MAVAASLAAVAACGNTHDGTHDDRDNEPPHAPVKHDAGVAPVDWTACDAALAGAPAASELDRAGKIIAACQVCGDWRPLLDWARPHEEGGPTRAEIESAMTACDAYCGAESKDRFLGTLDSARGTDATAPWRWLAKACKEQVSAAPDARYASPQLFVLDRIARAAFKHGDGAALSAIHLALPAVSITGAGLALPPAHRFAAALPARQVTVTETEVRTGPLPHATLGEHGLAVELGDSPYPGALVTDPSAMAGSDDYVLFAPRAMPAVRIVEALPRTAAAARFAAVPADAPAHWQVPGAVEIAVVFAKPPRRYPVQVVHLGDALPNATDGPTLVVELHRADTVEQVVKTLEAAAAAGWKSAAVIAAPR